MVDAGMEPSPTEGAPGSPDVQPTVWRGQVVLDADTAPPTSTAAPEPPPPAAPERPDR